MRWRLHHGRFRGAGNYEIDMNGEKIILNVDDHGVFEIDGMPFPVHAIANLVGSKRDFPYIELPVAKATRFSFRFLQQLRSGFAAVIKVLSVGG